MSSRSRSPEKKKASNTREFSTLDPKRSGIDLATKRFEKANPQTPPTQRFASSTYSSPGSMLGREEDAIIIELQPKYLLGGIEGESNPQCRIDFNPHNERRVGDHRMWLPGYTGKQEELSDWGRHYELWRNDLTGLDLGLMCDKLERNIREMYNKYLLVDAGSARLVLVLPSLVPHPVLEAILLMLFEQWKFSNITLLPAPTMSTFAAGLRSALVVDVGWEETTVTSIYEYRETKTIRSSRGMKKLSLRLAEALRALIDSQPNASRLTFTSDCVEELLIRTIPLIKASKFSYSTDPTAARSSEVDGQKGVSFDGAETEIEWSPQQSIDIVKVPIRLLSEVIGEILISKPGDDYADDDERAVPMLMFDALLAMSPDMRAVCMSRVIFTGQINSMKVLKEKIIDTVSAHVSANGWCSVKGKNLNPKRSGLAELAQARTSAADAAHNVAVDIGKDYVEDRVRKTMAKRVQSSVIPAELREVISLGSWTGASLLTSLKIRGFVEIEREKFLTHGLAGASRDTEISVVAQPQRMSTFGIPKGSKVLDRVSWTLAGWG